MVPPPFVPIFQYLYTALSAISVTFCNSDIATNPICQRGTATLAISGLHRVFSDACQFWTANLQFCSMPLATCLLFISCHYLLRLFDWSSKSAFLFDAQLCECTSSVWHLSNCRSWLWGEPYPGNCKRAWPYKCSSYNSASSPLESTAQRHQSRGGFLALLVTLGKFDNSEKAWSKDKAQPNPVAQVFETSVIGVCICSDCILCILCLCLCLCVGWVCNTHPQILQAEVKRKKSPCYAPKRKVILDEYDEVSSYHLIISSYYCLIIPSSYLLIISLFCISLTFHVILSLRFAQKIRLWWV